MDPLNWPPRHSWHKLLLCTLLAAVLHLLLLWLLGPRPGAAYTSTILRPVLFALAPAPIPVQPVVTPAPDKRRPAARPARPAAAPPVLIPDAPEPPPEPTPVAQPTPPEPTPVEAAAEPAPETPPPVASSLPAPLTAIPGSQKLKYSIFGEVRKLHYRANGELLWAHDGEEYEARLEVGAFLLGSRVQTSQGRITPDGLKPRRFTDRSRKDRVAELDHEQAEARFSEGAPPTPLLKGAQDQLSVFVQLASLLAANPQNYPRGTELALQAVGIKGSDTWHFIVNGEETLDLPGGKQNTLMLTRLKQQAGDLGVEIWLAPALGWLPARIRLIQENGDYIDQQWRGSEAP